MNEQSVSKITIEDKHINDGDLVVYAQYPVVHRNIFKGNVMCYSTDAGLHYAIAEVIKQIIEYADMTKFKPVIIGTKIILYI